MLTEITTIKIIQNSNSVMFNPITNGDIKRNNTLEFQFVNTWEYTSSWDNLSSTGKVTFPKNINVRYSKSDDVNSNNSKKSIEGNNINISDLFRRGDNIIIESFYEYWDKDLTPQLTPLKKICDCYITNVTSDNLIELEFEDSMYLLKQIPMPNYTFPKNVDIRKKLISIIKDGLSKLNSKLAGDNFVIAGTENDFFNGNPSKFYNNITNSGNETISFDGPIIATEHETVSQFLARLKKDFFVKSFFRIETIDNKQKIVLYITFFPYNYMVTKSIPIVGDFVFQDNIISNDLKYRMKDDIILSAVCSNYIMEDTGKRNKDGTNKQKKRRIEVLIYSVPGSEEFKSKIIKKGETVPANQGGERRTFVFLSAKTEDDLIKRGKSQLQLYYYNGFSGKFLTFGTPHIVEGNVIKLSNPVLKQEPTQNGKKVITNNNSVQIYNKDTEPINPIIKDREGIYFVKRVSYSGGVNGYRQEIEIDFRLVDKNSKK